MSLNFSLDATIISARFKSSYNNLVVFTEDKELTKIFYERLFNRLMSDQGVRVGVTPLGSCETVREEWSKDVDYSYPKIYLVDGDIFIMYSSNDVKERFFQLDRYCIENFLSEKKTICSFIQRISGVLTIDEIESKLNYDELMSDLSQQILPLYYYCAIAAEKNHGCFGHLSFFEIFDNNNASFKKENINKKKADLKKELIDKSLITEEEFNHKISEMEVRIPTTVDNALKFLSGKSHIFPYLYFYLKKNVISCPLKTDAWKFNCAELCDLSIFSSLKRAMIDSIEITRIKNQNCSTEH